ncbi:MAG: LysM domain-containing protein [Phycisphaerales bacterium]
MAKVGTNKPAGKGAARFSGVLSATHVVRPGECLWKIAEDELGDPLRWPEIASANGLGLPYVIFAGQTIKLPKPNVLPKPAAKLSRVAGQTSAAVKPRIAWKVDPRATRPAPIVVLPAYEIDVGKIEFPPIPMAPGVTATFAWSGTVTVQSAKVDLPVKFTKESYSVEYKNQALKELGNLFSSMSAKMNTSTGSMEVKFSLGSEVEINGKKLLGTKLSTKMDWTGAMIVEFEMSNQSNDLSFGEFKASAEWGWTCEVRIEPRKNPGLRVNPLWAPLVIWEAIVDFFRNLDWAKAGVVLLVLVAVVVAFFVLPAVIAAITAAAGAVLTKVLAYGAAAALVGVVVAP